MKKLCVLFLILTFLLSSMAEGQSVGVNDDGSAPHTSAMLDVKSATKGMLIPRVALTSTNVAGPVVSPLTSLLVYNTASAGSGGTAVTPGFYYWNGAAWEKISSSSTNLNAWSLTGNAGTNAAVNFIGTTDNQPLVFKVNNFFAGSITSDVPTGNHFFGLLSGSSLTSGIRNTGTGSQALRSNTMGYDNTATGSSALMLNTTGNTNSSILSPGIIVS